MWKTNIKKTKDKVELSPSSPWNDRYMKLAKTVKNWQLAFLSMLIMFSISLFVTLRISTKASFVPYIVEIKETGEVTNIVRPLESRYSISDIQYKHYLRQFLIKIRSIPLDPVLFSTEYKEALKYTGLEAKTKLRKIYMEDNINQKFKEKESRNIQINSIVKVPNTNSFKVRWEETSYKEGGISKRINQEGIFSLKSIPAKTEAELIINPLGITITDLSINQDF